MPNIISDLNEDYIHSLRRNKLFEEVEYTPVTITRKLHESIYVSRDRTVYTLIDKVQYDTVSFIAGEYVTYHNQDLFEIRGTYSLLQSRGYLSYLFELLIYDFNFKIISDANHTSPGSKEFWKSLTRNKKLKVYRYDIKSNYKKLAGNFRDDQIWGLSQKEKDILENRKLEFKEFEGIDPLDVIDDSAFRTDEGSNENFLNRLGEEYLVVDPRIIRYQEFSKDYKELIKSKENIRLIAEKSNRG